jgi:hypothetical protein
MAIPKFVAGLASQPFTWAVTSTSTNELAKLTGAPAKDAPSTGPVEEVTPVSVQALRTGEKVNVPAAVTLLM